MSYSNQMPTFDGAREYCTTSYVIAIPELRILFNITMKLDVAYN